MKNHEWIEGVSKVMPYVVKISTPDSYGSGFLMTYNPEGKHSGISIATAAHVVQHAAEWREVIRVKSPRGEVLLKPDYYTTVIDEDTDLALLQFVNDDYIQFPEQCLPWCGKNDVFPAGMPVGWCGFPNIADSYCCFFEGTISTPYSETGDYLVDGVVINGVSGGPAFIMHDDVAYLIGLVSAYLPNMATGDALPGLGHIASISPLLHFFADKNKAIAAKKRTETARKAAARMSKDKSGDNFRVKRVLR